MKQIAIRRASQTAESDVIMIKNIPMNIGMFLIRIDPITPQRVRLELVR